MKLVLLLPLMLLFSFAFFTLSLCKSLDLTNQPVLNIQSNQSNVLQRQRQPQAQHLFAFSDGDAADRSSPTITTENTSEQEALIKALIKESQSSSPHNVSNVQQLSNPQQQPKSSQPCNKHSSSQHLPNPKSEDKFSYGYAIDLNTPLTSDTFLCVRKAGYTVAFVRVFQPNGNGVVDTSGPNNVKNAYSAGLGVEIYVAPQPQGTKPGRQQFDETYMFLKNNGVDIQAIWLQVTSPIYWPNNQQANIAFINDFLNRARQYGLRVGIYTNWYDWHQITASWTGWSAQGRISLWYWNANGYGAMASSSNNFQDFRPFAGFNNVATKQYSQSVNVCGAVVGQNIFAIKATSQFFEMLNTFKNKSNNDRIAVGTIEFLLN